MSLLVTNYHGQSAAAASRFYRASARTFDESPTPSRLIRLAPEPSEEWLTRAFGFSGPGMLQRDTVRPEHGPVDDAGHRGADRARRWPYDDRWTRSKADPVAVGWYR
jgi:hypothetical protein